MRNSDMYVKYWNDKGEPVDLLFEALKKVPPELMKPLDPPLSLLYMPPKN